MQPDIRISFEELEHGLALDKEYGPKVSPQTGNRTYNSTCMMLLETDLARHDLTTNDFHSEIRSFGCHNMLIRVWLGYEDLPFYFPGKEHPVRFDVDAIRPALFLKESDCQGIEISKKQLALFLSGRGRPLPASDVKKNRSLWFHGTPFSTEFRVIN